MFKYILFCFIRGGLCLSGMLFFLHVLRAQTPALAPTQAPEDVFSFHLLTEPGSLDPARFSSTDAGYFFPNLHHGLYKYHRVTGLQPEGARVCRFPSRTRVVCDLDPEARWSDGSPVLAADYVRAFRHLVGPESKSLGVELLGNVAHAMEVFAGKKPPEQLGARAVKPYRLEIELIRPDPDFLYKLALPHLAPIKSERFPEKDAATTLIVNGPYKIESWLRRKRVRLVPNPFYKKGHPQRPPVDVYFVDDDETALTLYKQGKLKFLRRLATSHIPKFQARADFVQVAIARFDYLGFGAELKNQPELRRAMALALNFDELRRLYHAPKGRPGCPGIPETFTLPPTPCLSFDLTKAKRALAAVPPELKARRYVLAISKLGGDDPKKGAEWMQAQWRKHLGLHVDIEQIENGIFLDRLRRSPPTLFRKGVSLERPTCLAALETFADGGPENFLKLQRPAYQKILAHLGGATTESDKRRFCTQGVRDLLDHHLLIPLGEIHFTMLADPRFQGWSVSETNQLDLARLHIKTERAARK